MLQYPLTRLRRTRSVVVFDLGGVLKAVPLTPVFILMAGTHLQHPPHTYNTHPTLTTPTPHKRQQPPHTSIKEHKNTKWLLT